MSILALIESLMNITILFTYAFCHTFFNEDLSDNGTVFLIGLFDDRTLRPLLPL